MKYKVVIPGKVIYDYGCDKEGIEKFKKAFGLKDEERLKRMEFFDLYCGEVTKIPKKYKKDILVVENWYEVYDDLY